MPFFSRWARICVWWYECVEVYGSFSQSYKLSADAVKGPLMITRVTGPCQRRPRALSLSPVFHCQPFNRADINITNSIIFKIILLAISFFSTLRWYDISYSPPGPLSRWQRHVRQRGRADALRHKTGTKVWQLDRVN